LHQKFALIDQKAQIGKLEQSQSIQKQHLKELLVMNEEE
jgi:hypothetical protein